MLLYGLLSYVLHPRVVFTHVVGGGLLYGLTQTGADRRLLAAAAVAEELVALLLWAVIPNSFATIFALTFCIWVYEKIVGPRVEISKDPIFVSDEDISDVLKNYGDGLEYTYSQQAGRHVYATKLQYVAFANNVWGKQPEAPKVLELESVSSVEEGCDYNIIRTVRAAGAEPRQCFQMVLGAGESTVSFICPQSSVRDQWVECLGQLYSRRVQDLRSVWMEKVYKTAEISDPNGRITLEEAVAMLNKANRATDKAYVKDIFNTFAKISNVKTASGSTALNQEQFGKFFDMTSRRPEIQNIYERLLDKSKSEKLLSATKFKKFLEDEQKERVNMNTVKLWIRSCETILPSYNLTSIGFTNYLMSPDHHIFNRDHGKVYQDMKQPLSHYFIATSHNTYLTKDQLKGKSSVQAYIDAFKRGCKCVELDCWDGPNNDPIIYHGHTLTSKIKFKDVIQGIKDYAFVVSQYPVILSFENHCSVEQQQVMAKYLTSILGDLLYTKEPPESESELPSPEKLKGYIIVKNKKLKPDGGVEEHDDDFSDEEVDEKEVEEIDNSVEDDDEDAVLGKSTRSALMGILGQTKKLSSMVTGSTGTLAKELNGSPEKDEKKKEKDEKKDKKKDKDKDKEDTKSLNGSIQSTEDDKENEKERKGSKKQKVPNLAHELSDLVAYCQATHFKSFKNSRENAKHYEMSSFAEKKAMKFAREQTEEFLEYNKRQLSRIYPAGSRIDSSNYDPHHLWSVGCQLVALNYQTGTHPMNMNQALFTDNGFCGYVLKPKFMRDPSIKFDPRGPFEENTATKITVKVICGYQLPYKSEKDVKSDRGLSVEVRISGVESDCNKQKTKVVKNNGFNPTWNEEISLDVNVPELAFLTFFLWEGNTAIGRYVIRMTSVQQGYRIVPLTNKMSEPILHASLFVHVDIKK